jgi:hypothetical protein
MATKRKAAFTFILGLAVAGPAWRAAGQADVGMRPTGGGGAATAAPVVVHVDDPSDPKVQEYARRQKRRVELEKELHKLRFEYFGTMRNTEIRQSGLHKLRTYTDPVLYPSLLKIFAKEKMDVRGTILDMLADGKNDEADATLTWGAIFDDSREFRDAAAQRLMRRIKDNGGEATARIKSVIAEGLKQDKTDDELAAAAHLAQTLKLYEALPMLISAQLGGQQQVVGGGNDGGGETSLAWILVGTQTAFVADLTPVVGDSAVAFDPTIGVVTEGTYIRVIDAVVVTYRYEVHNALVGLSSAGWGKPTNYLGFDNPAWRKWYNDEFVPYRKSLAAAEAEKK